MATKEGKVRLTEEAHGLCAEMAHDCDSSMKNIASEAIIRMSLRNQNDRRYPFGTFALGLIAGAALSLFFIGLVV